MLSTKKRIIVLMRIESMDCRDREIRTYYPGHCRERGPAEQSENGKTRLGSVVFSAYSGESSPLIGQPLEWLLAAALVVKAWTTAVSNQA